ncbi:hypothetical protein [Chryseobacterium sp. StRB126]|nr:hypothetical protein [Chryseobacterium sp. StRB126]
MFQEQNNLPKPEIDSDKTGLGNKIQENKKNERSKESCFQSE